MLNTAGLLSSFYITLFGGVFLFAASNKTYLNRRYLSIFFLNSFILFAGHFVSFFEYWNVFRFFDFAFISALLAFYPFYYKYLHIAFGLNYSKLNWRLHFTPALFVGFTMLTISFIASYEDFTSYMKNNLYGTPTNSLTAQILVLTYKISRGLHVLQILAYNFIAIRYIIIARNHFSNTFSNLDTLQMQYFYLVNVVFLIFMAIPGIYVTIIGRKPFVEGDYTLGIVSLIFTFLYVILGIVGLRQEPSRKIETDTVFFVDDHKSHHPGMSPTKTELLNYFETELPYLHPNLNIWDVSKALGTNRTYVSKLINKETNCNFNAFVNTYRTNKAKAILCHEKYKYESLDTIAELCGFGSASSFLRVFKDATGMTPSAYRERDKSS